MRSPSVRLPRAFLWTLAALGAAAGWTGIGEGRLAGRSGPPALPPPPAGATLALSRTRLEQSLIRAERTAVLLEAIEAIDPHDPDDPEGSR